MDVLTNVNWSDIDGKIHLMNEMTDLRLSDCTLTNGLIGGIYWQILKIGLLPFAVWVHRWKDCVSYGWQMNDSWVNLNSDRLSDSWLKWKLLNELFDA